MEAKERARRRSERAAAEVVLGIGAIVAYGGLVALVVLVVLRWLGWP